MLATGCLVPSTPTSVTHFLVQPSWEPEQSSALPASWAQPLTLRGLTLFSFPSHLKSGKGQTEVSWVKCPAHPGFGP